ncbi:MAG: hypothetical protein MUF48_17190 [Pirellulaceae bacterium]|nr:hypothetical protein [Pirellulaceae bacterium]
MRRCAKKADVVAAESEELCFAVQLLSSLMALFEEDVVIDVDERPTTRMVYTNGVTLWLLILQRLGGGKTLEETISHLLAHDFDLLPDNKRVREGRISANTATYAHARKRVPLEFILDVSERICDRLSQMSPPIIEGKRVFILDGTTITLAPTKALQEAFPPAPNQHGQSVWPVAMLMLANELQSGCASLPQIDPMYGDNNASEAVQAHRILGKLPANSIVMADTGFGIYSVAHHCTMAGHEFFFRLSHARFKALRQDAELIDEGLKYKTYKRQPLIEKRFSQFKTDFEVAPVYLKEVTRIQRMLCVYFFALMVQTLLERELRQALANSDYDTIPMYPEHRACQAPTTRRVLDIFENIQRHSLSGDGARQTFVTQLTPLQRQIVNWFQLSPKKYGA